jgi:hypothetical protein
VHRTIISVLKLVEFVSDRMLYVIKGGQLCDIIILKVYATTEDKTYDVKDTSYDKLEHVLNCLINSLNIIQIFCYKISVSRLTQKTF